MKHSHIIMRTMTKDEIFKALLYFNEKADKFRKLSFVKKGMEVPAGAKMSWEAGRGIVSATRTGPNEEEIDAAALTFRFFIQKNEKSSIIRMADVYSDPLLEPRAKECFDGYRKAINDYLDEPTGIEATSIATGQKEIFTNRKIMETFLFGGLVHGNEELKKNYDGWKGMVAGPWFEALFVSVLCEVFSVIWKIRTLNHTVMNREKLGHW